MVKTPKPPPFLTVGDVAKRSGVAVSTLHFYEAKGLITSVRSRGNQRRFSRDVLRRISIIRVAQSLGISLAEIMPLLKPIPPGKHPSAEDVREMVGKWRTVLQERIDRLSQLRDHLDRCIGCGCLSMEDCPLRNPADELAASGAGAVLLATPSSSTTLVNASGGGTSGAS